MTSTDSLELKATISSDPSWITVAKGSRSLTRRTKKQNAQTAAQDIEAEYKSSSNTAAGGDSDLEKFGVSVLGHHFAERVEHVPIKKRRFMVPAPSPLNRSSANGEDSQHSAEFNNALLISRLNPILMNRETTKVSDDKPDCSSHDFSGIKILAEVACSSDMSSNIASVVDGQPFQPLQQRDALSSPSHVESNDSSTRTVDVSEKYSTIEFSDKVGDGKNEIVVPQNIAVDNSCNALAADQSDEHSMVASSGMTVTQNISIASNESSAERPKENMEASDSGNLAPQSEIATVSEKLSSDVHSGNEKKTECLTDDRSHWDLNLPTDVWGQRCDVADVASPRYSDGEVTEVTESVTESGHVDGSNDSAAGLVASDVHKNSPSKYEPKAEASARNGKECQSGYDSQFEDGELREPYPWKENDGDSDVQHVDYGSEPENDQIYYFAESNDNKQEDVEKGIMGETKCGADKCESGNVHGGSSDIEKHVIVCTNDSHSKGSSPSRNFGSKPFKELPSHETFPRRRHDSYKGLSERDAGRNKLVGRDRTGMHMRSRSPGKGQFGGWDSKSRFSSPIYEGGPYGPGRPHHKTVVEDRDMMNGFDQAGPDQNGYVRREFLNEGYRGQFRRFSDVGGKHDFRGWVDRPFPPSDTNNYPSRMHNNRMNGRRERSISPPVFRRFYDPQSRSRSGSRPLVSWNERSRPHPGFRNDENRMESVRYPFEARFPLDQEMGFISPPRNQRNSRFFNDRNNDGTGENHHHNNLRGRESPPRRMFRPEQRFDNTRRVDLDNNNFRPFMRHNNRRFVDGGGACKYEGTEEKNGNMYRPPMPQHVDTVEEDGDNVRPLRVNEEPHTAVSNKEAS